MKESGGGRQGKLGMKGGIKELERSWRRRREGESGRGGVDGERELL